MTIKEPIIIWENDNYGALFLVYEYRTCYVVHIVFDVFPFDDLATASEMLSSFASINDADGEEIHIVFVVDVDEGIEDLTERLTCAIIELSERQDNWINMNPLERMQLFGEVSKDA